jgi:hypothetical protein
MKKTIAITSALAAASSLATAEIKINEFLSFEGFVDMSYTHVDRDSNPGKESDNTFGVDQVEIDWLFNFGKVTAQVDLEYEENGGVNNESGTGVEQAFVAYELSNGASITAGRYETMLGLEAKEPTGLYQYSTAYSSVLGGIDGPFNNYAQGVKYSAQSGDLSYAISLQDEAFGYNRARLGGDNNGSYGVEAAASLTSGAITYFLGGAYEDGDTQGDSWLANGHVTYVDGAWTIGAEAFVGNSSEGNGNFGNAAVTGNDLEVQGGLIMANYAYSDCCSVTGRVGYVDYDGTGSAQEDQLKYTLAHNYAVTDNLAVITEVSLSEYENNAGADEDELLGAVEVLFTF